MSEYVVEMHDIVKTFGHVTAVNNGQFTLKKGEIHSLIGENGAGKSTMMKLLYGMYPIDSGVIRVKGEEIPNLTPKTAIEHGIGMVHQEFMLVGELSVLENTILGFEPKKGLRIDFDTARKSVQKYIDEIYKAKAEGKGIPFQIEIGDYYTPEYARVLNYDTEKWELCRGVGMSFGYNRNENPANFMKAKDVIWCIIDVTAKNGNLLLNVGPLADGTIQKEQMEPLLETGAWLKVNGEAIYATTCREDKQSDVTKDGKEVRYTKKGDALYAIVMDEQPGKTVAIEGLEVPEGKKVEILGMGDVEFCQKDGALVVALPDNMPPYAYVLKIA